jgi:aspartate aminotransferase-like enzyme
MDAWGIDVVVGGSQKAFMLPTGLSFVSFSQKAQKSKKNPFPRFYWDLDKEKKENIEGKTRYSTPVQFILALEQVLQIMNTQGIANYFKSIEDRAQYFRKNIQLQLFPTTPSPSLSCVNLPGHLKAKVVTDAVLQKTGLVIMGGQDQLKDSVIRVGHMGDMSHEDLGRVAQAVNSLL